MTASPAPVILGPLHRELQREQRAMTELVPGGYLFTHLIFWTVVGMVAIGTNAVPIILSVGLVMMAMDALKNE